MAKQTKKLFIEGLLIVFSVLFALFISQMVENRKARIQKEQALDYIYQELEGNQGILKRWIWKHGQIRDRLRQMVSDPNDSMRRVLESSSRLDFGVISDGESLIDALLTETAWEAAKSTKTVADFDFKLVQEFTRIYGLQKILMAGSSAKFLEVYLDRESHEVENLPTTLIQLNLVMEEMVGQEQTLLHMINAAIEKRQGIS